jgi:hypothetical protein
MISSLLMLDRPPTSRRARRADRWRRYRQRQGKGIAVYPALIDAT